MAGAVTDRDDAPRGQAPEGESISSRTRVRPLRLVAGILLAVGVWGTVAPYVGPEVPVEAVVEVVDHVVPGIIVLAVALFSLYQGRFELISSGLAFLAALWMFTTHVPLLAQATRGEFPWAGSLWMFVPSALLLVLTIAAAVLAWREAA